MKGKPHESEVIEFGEVVMYRMESRTHSKLEDRWDSGVYLGRKDSSDEAIMGTPRGIVTARAVRRRLKEEAWSVEELTSCVGVPWDPRGTAQEPQSVTGGERRYITRALLEENG